MKFKKIQTVIPIIARKKLKQGTKEEKDRTIVGKLWGEGGNTLSFDTIVISGNLPRSILEQHTKVRAQCKSRVTANIVFV